MNKTSNEKHPFHIVNPSPWPFYTSMSLWAFALQVIQFYQYMTNYYLIFLTLGCFLYILKCWFMDIIIEATFEGHHTQKVQTNIRVGMALFIISEGMFFFSFFWAYFHFSLSSASSSGGIWPPLGIVTVDPWGLPLTNTAILLSSGITVTLTHSALISANRDSTTIGLLATIIYGLIFTCIQLYEYNVSSFSMSDGIFGALFYMCTGFHGIHVFIGDLFLLVSLIRHLDYHFTPKQHVGLECAIWYWHFVDVVWLFLYIIIYIWGG